MRNIRCEFEGNGCSREGGVQTFEGRREACRQLIIKSRRSNGQGEKREEKREKREERREKRKRKEKW